MSSIFLSLTKIRQRVLLTNKKLTLLVSTKRGQSQILSTEDETSQEIDVRDKSLSHRTLLSPEIIKLLNPQDGQIFIDMTFGEGGHSKQLLSSGKDIRILAVDRDPVAFKHAIELSQQSHGQVVPLLAKFSEVPAILTKHNLKKGSINGIIMDLGPSDTQLNDPSRGFSYSMVGPLDMRMDGKRFPESLTAKDVIYTLDSVSLAKIFKTYGEDRLARKYANAIVDARFMLRKFHTTIDLANLIDSLAAERVISDIERTRTSASKVFRALRIFVNNELNELHYAITKMREYLHLDATMSKLCSEKETNMKALDDEIRYSDSGKLAVLSKNPLEDTITKRNFQNIDMEHPLVHVLETKLKSHLHNPSETEISRYAVKKWYSLAKTAVVPSKEELNKNPGQFISKLRIAARVF